MAKFFGGGCDEVPKFVKLPRSSRHIMVMQELKQSPSPNPNQKKRENLFLNLGLNIILPSLILMKSGDWLSFPPPLALLAALGFPVGYGLFDFLGRKKYNFFSILGFISILITGGIGLLKLDKDWIAVKEAAVPSLFGLAVLATLKTRKPLVRLFLYNEQILNVAKVDRVLEKRHREAAFERLLIVCTMLVALSFLLSAILNFLLAKILIRSESGSAAFIEELGRMTFWSYPVIVLPSMIVMTFAMWKLLTGIKTLTGLELEDVFLPHPEPREEEEGNRDAASEKLPS